MENTKTIKELLIDFKVNNNHNSFIEIYNIMEYLLKKVITDVTYVYEYNAKNKRREQTKLSKQKYYKIYQIEKRLEKKLSMRKIMEKYKIEFIQKYYSENYSTINSSYYSLIYPFYIFIEKSNFAKLKKAFTTWKASEAWILANKFCDFYWEKHIIPNLNRDYGKTTSEQYNVTYLKSMTLSGDSLIYKYHLYSDLESELNINGYDVDLKEILLIFQNTLKGRKKELFILMYQDFSKEDIMQILNISDKNYRKIKSELKLALFQYIKTNDKAKELFSPLLKKE